MNIPVTFTESSCHFAPQFGSVVQIGGAPEPQKIEVHQITVASDLTSGVNVLLTGNQFIIDHYQEDGFIVQLINLHVLPQGTTQIGYGYGSNRGVLPSGDTFTYGYALYRTATGSPAIYHKYVKVDVSGGLGVPYVTAAGSVVVSCDASRVLTAGDYLIVLSVAEV